MLNLHHSYVRPDFGLSWASRLYLFEFISWMCLLHFERVSLLSCWIKKKPQKLKKWDHDFMTPFLFGRGEVTLLCFVLLGGNRKFKFADFSGGWNMFPLRTFCLFVRTRLSLQSWQWWNKVLYCPFYLLQLAHFAPHSPTPGPGKLGQSWRDMHGWGQLITLHAERQIRTASPEVCPPSGWAWCQMSQATASPHSGEEQCKGVVGTRRG